MPKSDKLELFSNNLCAEIERDVSLLDFPSDHAEKNVT